MKIEHIAIWTQNLEQLKAFYETYFGAQVGSKYVNRDKAFESYFLSFSSGARLELMQSPKVADPPGGSDTQLTGYAHLAFSVGSKEHVQSLTTRLGADGYKVISPPRVTGDGYYESVVLDPDGNRIEITL